MMRIGARRSPTTIARTSIFRILPHRRADIVLWALGALVLLSIVGFAGYYYYDRYVHTSETLLDTQARQVEAMILQNPQDPDLRATIASYYADGGLIDSAIQQAQEALKINPDHQGALFVLGYAYEKKGNLDGAIASLEKIIELNKDNQLAKIDTRIEGVYYQLAGLYDRQGKPDKAIDALKKAVEIDGTDSDALYALGALYQKQGDHASAVSQFQEALRFDPYFDEPYQGLATSYAALGKSDEAAYAKGMVAFAQGDASGAAKQLEAVTAKTPDLIQAYFGLGLAYEQLGKRDQAKAALQRFLAANPTDMAANEAMSRLNQEVKP
jgi:protein O-GlcNAc transferase